MFFILKLIDRKEVSSFSQFTVTILPYLKSAPQHPNALCTLLKLWKKMFRRPLTSTCPLQPTEKNRKPNKNVSERKTLAKQQ